MELERTIIASLCGALALCLVAPQVTAQYRSDRERLEMPFRELDTDSDRRITPREIRRSARRMQRDMDLDGDGTVEKAEVASTILDAWDANATGTLDRREFAAGARMWIPPTMQVRFADLDRDHNHLLSRAEFMDGLDRVGYLAYWDVDRNGVLSANEVSHGMIASLDDDADGSLEEREWPLG